MMFYRCHPPVEGGPICLACIGVGIPTSEWPTVQKA